MALKRVWIPSPNYSSRGGAGVRLIVLHTAEGATTIESLGNFFASSSAGVSSHAGADDKANTIGEYVKRGNKAWTQAEANPVAVSIEACGFASWSTSTWQGQHGNMLNNIAAWIAEEAKHFGIPIVKLSSSQAQGGGKGVCQHRDLGSWGGNHSDCGNGFPMDDVLAKAGGTKVDTPPPSSGKAPPFPGTNLEDETHGHGTREWQQKMSERGWSLDVDDIYDGESSRVCTQFQQEKGLGVDGIVGPETWEATWTAPVT
jgi:N-acetyl-anhydromuramyl-L-alanine amidase AmpD